MVAIIEKDNLNSLQSILNKIVDGGVWKKKKKKLKIPILVTTERMTLSYKLL